MFVKKPPIAVRNDEGEKEFSRRLKVFADTEVYEVSSVINDKSFYFVCPDTKSADDIKFTLPITLDRLILIEDFELEDPINPEEELWIDIKTHDNCAAKQWYKRRIVGQNSTGSVRIESENGGDVQVVDLAEREWMWSFPPTKISQVPVRPHGIDADLTS